MSVELIVEVLDNAPGDLDPQELAVLIVYAEQARSSTRLACPKLSLVARRARCSERTASTLIDKLVARGLLQHVARGQKYRKATYRLLGMPGYGDASKPTCRACGASVTRTGTRGPWPKRCLPCKTSAGNPELHPEEPSARNSELRAEDDSAGSPELHPEDHSADVSARNLVSAQHETHELRASRHSPKHSLSADLERIVIERSDATPDEARELAKTITAHRKPKSPLAYFRAIPKEDLAVWLQELRDSRSQPCTPTVAELRRGPECEHGDPGGASLHPVSGKPLCPHCRTAASRRSA